jgi:predicted DCC family thiol-disulfide oxidoreductase YuxK
MTATLTLFYDGYCPLCVAEMNHLRKLDETQKIRFEDIQADDFSQRYPQLVWSDLNARIHAQMADGSLVSGLDVTYLAWKLVGKGWVYAPLRWPLIRILADFCYEIFAKHRYRISYWLTGKKRTGPQANCQRCVPLPRNHHE